MTSHANHSMAPRRHHHRLPHLRLSSETYMVFGEFIKTSPAGSTRPIDVFPYVWTGLPKAQRLERIKGFPERQRQRDLETARRLVEPALAVSAISGVSSKEFMKAFDVWDISKLTGHVLPSGTSPARSRSADSPRDESMGRPSANGIMKLSTTTSTAAPSLPAPTTRRLV